MRKKTEDWPWRLHIYIEGIPERNNMGREIGGGYYQRNNSIFSLGLNYMSFHVNCTYSSTQNRSNTKFIIIKQNFRTLGTKKNADKFLGSLKIKYQNVVYFLTAAFKART
jgi:hypothetical protein